MPDRETAASPQAVEGVRYIITGRVQGVGYRKWTKRTAARHGIAGTVRNLPDGSVQVEAVGNWTTLKSFRAELHDGPPGARVTSVTAFEIVLPEMIGFEITY
jgi:acylphosphatase